MRRKFGPRTACLLGVGGASIAHVGTSPDLALAQQRPANVERFERQLEQIQRDTRVMADSAVPVDQRMIIDYGGYVSGSFASIDDPNQETHILRQYELVGYGRVNVDGAHELFARVRTSYRDFNSGDAFDQHGDDWTEPTLDRAHYRFDLQRYTESTRGVTPKANAVVQVGRQLINWGNGLTLSEEIDGVDVVFTYEPFSLELLAGCTRNSVADFDSSRPGFLGDTQRFFYGGQLSAQLGTHRPYAYALVQRDNNDQDTSTINDIETEYAYDSFNIGLGSSGSFTDQLLYGVELVYEGGDGLSNSFEFPFNQVDQSEEDIHAFAADVRLDYVLADKNQSRFSAELIYATGDADRLSTSSTFGGNETGTDDTAFNAFGLINTGLAYSPDVSNVLIGRLGALTFPLPESKLFSRMQIGVDGFVFTKANPDAPIDEPTEDTRYLGAEADLFINWQVSSDVAFTLRYGCFFPGNGIETDHDERHFLFTGLTYAFYGSYGLLLLALFGAAGCSSMPAAEPMRAELMANDVDAQMEFWHTLPERRVASNGEAFHALLLFVDGSDPAADYSGRVAAMKERRMLPADFNGMEQAAVKRGTVAVAIARALEIKGGLSMRLFGPTPRYAVRELQYMNLFPPSSPQQTFSGQELLGIIGRAEDHQRMFNEDALAETAATAPDAPPRGPASADSDAAVPESPAPDSEPQQP